MNTRPIKGNVNIETLNKVSSNLGGMSNEELEQELAWIANGITVAKGKIAREQSNMKAHKYVIRRANVLPERVVYLARQNYESAKEALLEAEFQKHQFMNNYRNFRDILYIRKSIELIKQQ